MKKICSLLLLPLCLFCCSALGVQAATQSFDFNALTSGDYIPIEGIEQDGVTLYGLSANIIDLQADSDATGAKGIAVWPGSVTITFDSSLNVDQITATMGFNNTQSSLQVFGSAGMAYLTFDDSYQWSSPVTRTINNIGTINALYFQSYEGFISSLEYNVSTTASAATPIPGALLLMGSGLVGLAGFVRRQR